MVTWPSHRARLTNCGSGLVLRKCFDIGLAYSTSIQNTPSSSWRPIANVGPDSGCSQCSDIPGTREGMPSPNRRWKVASWLTIDEGLCCCRHPWRDGLPAVIGPRRCAFHPRGQERLRVGNYRARHCHGDMGVAGGRPPGPSATDDGDAM
jgi:hypothetical protein